MIVNMHIDRLVLDGLPVGTHEGPLVQAAVAAELKRLIAAAGDVEHFGADRSVPLIRPETIAPPPGKADGIGAQIGQAIFAGIAR